MIAWEIRPSKMNKVEEAAAGVDRNAETTASKVKVNHMTSVSFTLNTIPWAAITASPPCFQLATFG